MNESNVKSSAFKTGLQELVPVEKPISKKALVQEHFETINEALLRGVRHEQVRDYFLSKGVDIGLSTLRQYVSEARMTAVRRTSKQKTSSVIGKPRKKKNQAPASDNSSTMAGKNSGKFVNIKDEDL